MENLRTQELAEQTTVDVLKISLVSLACKEDKGCTSESVKARVLQDMKSRINTAIQWHLYGLLAYIDENQWSLV